MSLPPPLLQTSLTEVSYSLGRLARVEHLRDHRVTQSRKYMRRVLGYQFNRTIRPSHQSGTPRDWYWCSLVGERRAGHYPLLTNEIRGAEDGDHVPLWSTVELYCSCWPDHSVRMKRAWVPSSPGCRTFSYTWNKKKGSMRGSTNQLAAEHFINS